MSEDPNKVQFFVTQSFHDHVLSKIDPTLLQRLTGIEAVTIIGKMPKMSKKNKNTLERKRA